MTKHTKDLIHEIATHNGTILKINSQYFASIADDKLFEYTQTCIAALNNTYINTITCIAGITSKSKTDLIETYYYYNYSNYSKMLQFLSLLLSQTNLITKLSFEKSSFFLDNTYIIYDGLQNNTSLTALNITNNNIAGKHLSELIQSLQHNTSLTELSLANNRLGQQSTKILADFINNNQHLVILNISHNKILLHKGTKNENPLLYALKNNTALSSLNMDEIKITDEGVTALADVLITNQSLIHLSIAGNMISVQGAKSIADALNCNKHLRILNLASNEFGSQGAEALANVLAFTNRSLTKLDISGNYINTKTIQEYTYSAMQNPFLTEVIIDNPLSLKPPIGITLQREEILISTTTIMQLDKALSVNELLMVKLATFITHYKFHSNPGAIFFSIFNFYQMLDKTELLTHLDKTGKVLIKKLDNFITKHFLYVIAGDIGIPKDIQLIVTEFLGGNLNQFHNKPYDELYKTNLNNLLQTLVYGYKDDSVVCIGLEEPEVSYCCTDNPL